MIDSEPDCFDRALYVYRNISGPVKSLQADDAETVKRALMECDIFKVMQHEESLPSLLSKVLLHVQNRLYAAHTPLLLPQVEQQQQIQESQQNQQLNYQIEKQQYMNVILRGEACLFQRKSQQDTENELFWNEQCRRELGNNRLRSLHVQSQSRNVCDFYKSKHSQLEALLRQPPFRKKTCFSRRDVCNYKVKSILGRGESFGECTFHANGPLVAISELQTLILPAAQLTKILAPLFSKRKYVLDRLMHLLLGNSVNSTNCEQHNKQLIELAHLFKEINVPEGQAVYKQGSVPEEIFLLADGQVRFEHEVRVNLKQRGGRDPEYQQNYTISLQGEGGNFEVKRDNFFGFAESCLPKRLTNAISSSVNCFLYSVRLADLQKYLDFQNFQNLREISQKGAQELKQAIVQSKQAYQASATIKTRKNILANSDLFNNFKNSVPTLLTKSQSTKLLISKFPSLRLLVNNMDGEENQVQTEVKQQEADPDSKGNEKYTLSIQDMPAEDPFERTTSRSTHVKRFKSPDDQLYKTLVSPLAIKIVHGRAKEFQFYATRLQNLRKIPHGKQNYQSDFENSETLYQRQGAESLRTSIASFTTPYNSAPRPRIVRFTGV